MSRPVWAEEPVPLSDGLSTLNVTDIEQELLAAPPNIRMQALSHKTQLRSLITPMFMDIRVAQAAMQEGFLKQPGVKEAIDRSTRNTIARLYITDKIEKALENLDNLEPLAHERYISNKSSYTVPESIRVAHILLMVDSESETMTEAQVRPRAEKLLQQLKEGVDFSKLAAEYSEDQGSKSSGGELTGWVKKGSLVVPFEKAAYTLKPGEISGLVRSRFGFHIIRLIDHKDGYVRPFSEVKDQLISAVKDELIAQRRDEVLSKFRGTKDVEIPDVVLDELRTKFKISGAPAVNP